MNYRIPFNKPFLVGKELYCIAQSVLGWHTCCYRWRVEHYRTHKQNRYSSQSQIAYLPQMDRLWHGRALITTANLSQILQGKNHD